VSEPGAGAPAAVRLLVVDDDPLVRSALRMVLDGAPGIELVGEAGDGSEVPEAVARLAPDVVLMDIRMPGVDGVTATERLRARPSPPEVVVLTTFGVDDLVMRALGAGASGFLLKDTPPEQILDAVRRVAAGDAMLSPSVTRQVITRLAGSAPDARREHATRLLERLTDRELEVAAALGRGLANAEIARQLHMSLATVKAHVSRLLTKLDQANRTQVALLAHDAGLV